MQKNKHTHQVLFCVTLLVLILVNYPLLRIFDVPVLVGGVPLLYFFLFAVWGGFILFLAFFTERHSHD